MKLSPVFFYRNLYRVKKGQTLLDIAEAFGLPLRVLAAENGLAEEVAEGQVLRIPQKTGNLYRVNGGESKTLLCGSPENFCKKNRTEYFYPTQTVFL